MVPGRRPPGAVGLTAGAYYYLHWAEVEDPSVAEAPDDPERDLLLDTEGPVRGWPGLSLALPPGDRAEDYLANDAGVRLCSPRLRRVIDDHLSPADAVQWLEAQVADGSRGNLPYFVPHLRPHPDVLDAGSTIRAGALVVKAVLDGGRAAAHHVFAFEPGGFRLIVSDVVREAIVAAGCTGVEFSRVPVV